MGIFGRARQRLSEKNGGATVIAEGCCVSGEVTGLKGPLYVEGTVEGRVISEAEIVVGPKGRLIGEVRARHLVVNGTVEGRIICEQLDIMAAGTVNGELMTGKMAIEPGGRFLGRSLELGDAGSVNILEVTFVEGEQMALEQKAASQEGSP